MRINNAVIISLLTGGLLLTSTHAAIRNWTDTLGGNFGDVANWDGAVPGTNDTALFNTESSGYTIDVTQSTTVQEFRVRTDILDLDIASGKRLIVSGPSSGSPLQIGRGADMVANVVLSGPGLFRSYASAGIGLVAGASGTLIISNGSLAVDGEFDIGSYGQGTLHVTSNGRIECGGKVIIASYPKAVGTATVDGGGWKFLGTWIVGWDNIGTFAASNGAVIRGSGIDKTATIGLSDTGKGSMTLSGTGTIWSNANVLRIGNEGTGYMKICDNAYVTVGDTTRIWDGSLLHLHEGILRTKSLTVDVRDSFAWTAGFLLLDDLIVGSSGPMSAMELSALKTLVVSNSITIESDGVLTLNGETLIATGNAFIQGKFDNRGTVNGPTTEGQTLTFDDPVIGSGSFSGNNTFNQTYSPGSSPASISFGSGNITFPESSILYMEIDGPAAGTQFDCLRNIAQLDFNGTLELIFNYTPMTGTEFDLLDFTTLAGSFANITVTGLPDTMRLDVSRLPTEGIIRALTPMEPDCLGLRLSGGDIQRAFEGDTGLGYTIQGTTNLVDTNSWSSLLTTNFLSSPFPWIEISNVSNTIQYYRVVLE